MKYILIVILVALLIATYIISQNGRFCLDTERAGIMLLKGGYRAWWIRYSDGLKYPYRKWKDNLWRRPRFERCDSRKLKGVM